ncbi:signal peptide peptidase-like 2A isoform X2 [Pantherophis guttatus]|uniref:Signal peptide peptidase-like 2A isoform X2 n=1 Tax=Pantherophis guttatus TaxID=94885 RepID=A0ABM3ZLN5_PANGU|nr:signal peptide peptidase-like 2A isoform X2 [Pantherophis guttatus]
MGAARLLGAALWALLLPLISAQGGVLHAVQIDSPYLTKAYCIYYNSNWTTLPKSLSNIDYARLEFLTPKLLCSPSDVTQDIKNKAIVVKRGNCTFLEKAEIAQRLGAKVLLVASETSIRTPGGNKTQNLTIPIALVRDADIKDLEQTLGRNVNVGLYVPPQPLFDYSLVIIFLIAMFCVSLGGYWSGRAELEKLKRGPNPGSNESLSDEETLTLTPLTVVIFVSCCCIMLVLMYFFYKWLVYVVIAIFCVASVSSMYACLSALLKNIPYGQCRFPCWNRALEVRLVFLFLFCLALSITWAVFRNEDSWAWILQNILGISFCLNFIKTLKMPNFKSCVILLGLLLLYDVFFVFITPYITKSGESIMVEVALGPLESSEKLPVVFKVPRLDLSPAVLCMRPFSLLGFGDIVIPGLLVAYCNRFDVQTSSSSVYYICCTIAYGVGMVVTFVCLVFMNKAQPALLYLVPCTLIPCALLALYRKEMRKFWNGNSYQVMTSASNEENVTQATQHHEGQ